MFEFTNVRSLITINNLDKAVKFLEDVFSEVPDLQFYLMGGSIQDLLNGEEPSDFDIYFKNQNDYFTAKNLLDEFGNNILETNLAVTYQYGNECIQLIKKSFGTAEEIMNGFDLCCCLRYIEFPINKNVSVNDQIVLSDRYTDETKILRITGNTFERVLKYLDKGHEFCIESFKESVYNALRLKKIPYYYEGDESKICSYEILGRFCNTLYGMRHYFSISTKIGYSFELIEFIYKAMENVQNEINKNNGIGFIAEATSEYNKQLLLTIFSDALKVSNITLDYIRKSEPNGINSSISDALTKNKAPKILGAVSNKCPESLMLSFLMNNERWMMIYFDYFFKDISNKYPEYSL